MGKAKADQEYDDDKQLKKTHSIITVKKKQRLIQFVIKDGLTIYRAAKRLKICHPTAKFIIKSYRLANLRISLEDKMPIQEEQQINTKNKIFQAHNAQEQNVIAVTFAQEQKIQAIQPHFISYLLPTQPFWTFYGYEFMQQPYFFSS